jgi:hypothetical protein
LHPVDTVVEVSINDWDFCFPEKGCSVNNVKETLEALEVNIRFDPLVDVIDNQKIFDIIPCSKNIISSIINLNENTIGGKVKFLDSPTDNSNINFRFKIQGLIKGAINDDPKKDDVNS